MMKRMKFFLFLILSSFSFFSLAYESVAVTIYDGANYKGQSLQLSGDTANLGNLDRKMSSFKVSPGYQVRFFEGQNFQGGYYTASSSVDDVSFARRIDNKIRSIAILDYPFPVAVTIFDRTNYLGKSMVIKGDTAVLGGFDEEVRSFKIEPGFQVRFYNSLNFQGGYYDRNSDDKDSANPYTFGTTVRSIKILQRPIEMRAINRSTQSSCTGSKGLNIFGQCVKRSPAIFLYDNEWMQGEKLTVYQELPQIPAWGTLSKPNISSYWIHGDYKVRFWTGRNFTGTMYTRAQGHSDQNNSGAATAFAHDSRINSVEIFDYDSPLIATLYSLPRYKGNGLQIREYDSPNTVKRRITSFSDLGSIKVSKGYKVIVSFDKNKAVAEFTSNKNQVKVKGTNAVPNYKMINLRVEKIK